MNANELADYLDNNVEAMLFTEQAYIDQAATMLRQQADRIGVLEANHKIQLDINEKALQYIEQLEQGLRASINLNRAQNERK
jgi:hypothetical protein